MRPHEAPALQSLGEETQSIPAPPQDLHSITRFATKHKQLSGERILRELRLHECGKPIEEGALAEVLPNADLIDYWTTSIEELKKKMLELNKGPQVHGILLQLPLPNNADSTPVLDLMDRATAIGISRRLAEEIQSKATANGGDAPASAGIDIDSVPEEQLDEILGELLKEELDIGADRRAV